MSVDKEMAFQQLDSTKLQRSKILLCFKAKLKLFLKSTKNKLNEIKALKKDAWYIKALKLFPNNLKKKA